MAFLNARHWLRICGGMIELARTLGGRMPSVGNGNRIRAQPKTISWSGFFTPFCNLAEIHTLFKQPGGKYKEKLDGVLNRDTWY